MKRQTNDVSTKEQRKLQRMEYALRLARSHKEGTVYLTDEGKARLNKIILIEVKWTSCL